MSSTDVYGHVRQGAAGDKKMKKNTDYLCCVPNIVLRLYIYYLIDG